MNRSIIVLLSIIAVSTAQFTCFSNSSTFSTVCVGVNPACTWTNASLWTNCNNNFPSSSAYSADIFGSNFTMTVNTGGPVATVDNVVFNVNFGTLAIQSDVNTGNVTIQSGTISVVNSTVNATGDSLDVEGGALYMSESNFVGTLNVMDSGSATVAGFNTFTGAVNNFGTVNILAQSTNQFSSLVTNNGSFIIDAPANVGGAGSLVSYGPITINAANNQLAASVSLNSVIYGQITVENSVLDTRAPQSFYATGINVLNGASVVLANGAFASFSNISNNGTINWVAGNNTIVNANGAFNNWGLFNFTTESDSPLLNSHVTIVNAGNFNIYSDDATVQVPSIDLYGTLTVNGAGVTITGQSSVAGVNETVPYATININGGVIAGGADDLLLKSDVNWSQGNMTVDAAQVLGLVNITGSEYKLLTTTLTAGSVQISGALQLETAYTNGVINNLGSVLMGNGATIYSTTQQTITNVGNNVTSAIMEGSFNLNGVNVVNSGIIGGINVPTTLNIVDGYLTLTPTSQLILGVGQSSTPAIMFTLSNVTSNATKVGATIDGSLTIVILPTFTPTNGNYTVFGTSGQPNINLIGGYNASNVNVTVLEGANANNCNYTVTPGANNYEITVVFSNCQTPSSPASKTWIIIVVVVVVVVVIAAIVGVVLYRRRNHASASEKQRLI